MGGPGAEGSNDDLRSGNDDLRAHLNSVRSRSAAQYKNNLVNNKRRASDVQDQFQNPAKIQKLVDDNKSSFGPPPRTSHGNPSLNANPQTNGSKTQPSPVGAYSKDAYPHPTPPPKDAETPSPKDAEAPPPKDAEAACIVDTDSIDEHHKELVSMFKFLSNQKAIFKENRDVISDLFVDIVSKDISKSNAFGVFKDDVKNIVSVIKIFEEGYMMSRTHKEIASPVKNLYGLIKVIWGKFFHGIDITEMASKHKNSPEKLPSAINSQLAAVKVSSDRKLSLRYKISLLVEAINKH